MREPFKFTEAQAHMFFQSESLGRFRIFPKGRRLGATHGAAIAHILWMNQGDACLWGDTINSNIDRYVERYFKPFLKTNKIKYNWSSQRKLLQVGDGYTDFRSADKPENWEGFGYKKIFLNEAGIILNNEYLYINAVLPMLIDFPDSQLIAAGTPKLLRGKGRLFYDLWNKVLNKEPGYHGKEFTTYDNPNLTRAQIQVLEKEIPHNEREQEIHGKFLLQGGGIVKLAWFGRYRIQPAGKGRIIQSWDTASKAKELNDPSVCTTWLDLHKNFYLLDVHREWLEYPGLKRAAKSLALNYSPDLILIEDKASGIALIQDLNNDTDFHYNIKAIEPDNDKITRMSTASLIIEAGRVFLPEAAPWLPKYEKEIAEFPEVENDDQVDSTSQLLNWAKQPAMILIG